MKIALAQIQGSPAPNENLAIARHFANEAVQHNASLLIFPEMFMALPRKSPSLSAIAEPIDGTFVASLVKLAEEYNLHIIAGIWEKVPDEERVYNTAILLSRSLSLAYKL